MNMFLPSWAKNYKVTKFEFADDSKSYYEVEQRIWRTNFDGRYLVWEFIENTKHKDSKFNDISEVWDFF